MYLLKLSVVVHLITGDSLALNCQYVANRALEPLWRNGDLSEKGLVIALQCRYDIEIPYWKDFEL